jgi:hypothetical protein
MGTEHKAALECPIIVAEVVNFELRLQCKLGKVDLSVSVHFQTP